MVGVALEGTGRGIESSTVFVKLYPWYGVQGESGTNVAFVHCPESRADTG